MLLWLFFLAAVVAVVCFLFLCLFLKFCVSLFLCLFGCLFGCLFVRSFVRSFVCSLRWGVFASLHCNDLMWLCSAVTTAPWWIVKSWLSATMLLFNSTIKESSGFAWVLRLLTATPTLKVASVHEVAQKGLRWCRHLPTKNSWCSHRMFFKLKAYSYNPCKAASFPVMDLSQSLQWKYRTEGGDDDNAPMYPWS